MSGEPVDPSAGPDAAASTATDAATSAETLVEGAERVANDVLAPRAEAVDRATTIPAENLAALATAGMFGLAGPVAAGGADAGPLTARRVVATIGGACGATFFVWVQHHGVVRTLRGTDRPELASLLPRATLEVLAAPHGHDSFLVDGERLAGALAPFVRRHGIG